MAFRTGELSVRTRELGPDDPRYAPPLEHLPLNERNVFSWLREGEGLIGWGVAVRVRISGASRFRAAEDDWHQLCRRFLVDDPVALPGTGPVAFASIAFGAEPGTSMLIVPKVIIGQRGGRRWITTVGEPETETTTPVLPPGEVTYHEGSFSATDYRQAVAEAVHRLRSSTEVTKVVLAHDLVARGARPIDPRFLLRNLTLRYPSCWTFCVDGLVGATPELLLELSDYVVRSHVLAGTAWPRADASEATLAAELYNSAKNRAEHALAARSLAERLRTFCVELTVPDSPEVLVLPNVLHLATNVRGVLSSGEHGSPGLLRVAEALHPTAAVGGTPTDPAVRLLGELEGMQRQRYAGPVGWVDAVGNGALGIALRCGQLGEYRPGQGLSPERLEPAGFGTVRSNAQAPEERQPSGAQPETAPQHDREPAGILEDSFTTDDPGSHAANSREIRLFAGCGIVAGSDPDSEVTEAAAKLRPMLEALAGPDRNGSSSPRSTGEHTR